MKSCAMTIQRTVILGVCSCVLWLGASAGAQTVIRVDGEDGVDDPPNFGDDWGNRAYLYLQDALARAEQVVDPPPAPPVEIWVRGKSAIDGGITYKPDEDSDPATPQYPDADAVYLAFELIDNVGVYGGFAGTEPGTAAGFASRNPAANLTILSGDSCNNAGIIASGGFLLGRA